MDDDGLAYILGESYCNQDDFEEMEDIVTCGQRIVVTPEIKSCLIKNGFLGALPMIYPELKENSAYQFIAKAALTLETLEERLGKSFYDELPAQLDSMIRTCSNDEDKNVLEAVKSYYDKCGLKIKSYLEQKDRYASQNSVQAPKIDNSPTSKAEIDRD
jgi:hypothetical protein